jgi:hypothetical protein
MWSVLPPVCDIFPPPPSTPEALTFFFLFSSFGHHYLNLLDIEKSTIPILFPMAANSSDNPQVPSTSNQTHLNSQSTVAMTDDEKMIAALVQKLVPVFKTQASAIPMQTVQAGGDTGGFSVFLSVVDCYFGVASNTCFSFALQGNTSTNQLEPVPLPEEPCLSPSFIVNQANVARSNVQETREKKKAERRVKGIAGRSVTIEHHHPFLRGIQTFLKFFLGGPNKPHKFPPPPSNAKKESQYWVEKHSQFISNQLALVRKSLSDKSVAEQDFFVSQAKEEIRKQMKLPPFTPAPKRGDARGSQPISSHTKGDVEREIA